VSTQDDYALRIAEATWKLEDAEFELRKATGSGLDFPAASFIAKALTAVLEAQSRLRGELEP
jgi:hypothetical protein